MKQFKTKVFKTPIKYTRDIEKGKSREFYINKGFNTEMKLSLKLSNFTGLKYGSRMQVIKFICVYIKKHKLQNPNIKRQIICDTELKNLLRYDTTGKPLTYFTLQRYLQPHYIKFYYSTTK